MPADNPFVISETLTTQPEEIVQPQVDWKTLAAVLLMVTLFASAFAGIRVGLQSYSPQSVALLRYLTASIFLAGYALIVRMHLPAWRDMPGIALSGFIGITVYNITLNTGEMQIPAGTASLIVASAPIFVALLATRYQQERIGIKVWAGIVLSFLGVAVITIEPGERFALSTGALLVLLAAVSSAVYTIIQKPFLRRYSPMQYVTFAFWAGTLCLMIFLPGLIRELPMASLESTLAVVYMGIFPAVVGYAAWAYLVSRMPASKAGSFLYLIPAFAILIAWVWLGELPDLMSFFGGILVVAGVLLVHLVRQKQR